MYVFAQEVVLGIFLWFGFEALKGCGVVGKKRKTREMYKFEHKSR